MHFSLFVKIKLHQKIYNLIRLLLRPTSCQSLLKQPAYYFWLTDVMLRLLSIKRHLMTSLLSIIIIFQAPTSTPYHSVRSNLLFFQKIHYYKSLPSHVFFIIHQLFSFLLGWIFFPESCFSSYKKEERLIWFAFNEKIDRLLIKKKFVFSR